MPTPSRDLFSGATSFHLTVECLPPRFPLLWPTRLSPQQWAWPPWNQPWTPVGAVGAGDLARCPPRGFWAGVTPIVRDEAGSGGWSGGPGRFPICQRT